MLKFISATALTLVPAAVSAAETEVVRNGVVAVADRCPLSAASVSAPRRQPPEKEIAFVPILLAALAGEAVKAGLNATGAAIENAAKEKGLVTEGASSGYAYAVRRPDEKHKTAWVGQKFTCIILAHIKDDAADVGNISTSPALLAIQSVHQNDGRGLRIFDSKQKASALGGLRQAGILKAPDVYVEAVIEQIPEGQVIRPILVWYAERQKGAGPGPSDAEFQISMATPGTATEIGTIFANARIGLPKIAPGDLPPERSLILM